MVFINDHNDNDDYVLSNSMGGYFYLTDKT